MIYILSIWIVFIFGFVLWDRHLTKDGGKPDYLKYFIIRGMAAIGHGVIFFMLYIDDLVNYSRLNAWQLLIIWLPLLSFQLTSFWILYEIGRNSWAKKPLLYYDQKEGDSGTIDRFFKWAGNTAHTFAKVAALVVCVLSVILLYHNYA